VSPTAADTLQIERTYEAPIERVFDAWTSPEVMRRWFHGRRAWETPTAEVDLRLGGAVRVVMRDPEDGKEYGGGGHYTAIDPPNRLAFTWTWDDDPFDSTLEVEFAESDGSTTVVLTHRHLPSVESVRNHEEGWRTCLENLAEALEA
jgi:uncharacterized protein YndB with AHSA1/START domain